MRVSRSLTIKQMAMVAAVVLVFVFIFCTVLLFHLVQQNRYNTATQLESIARSVREPLSSAILKGDIPEAEAILASIKPAGVVSRADVVLPNQFQALRKSFIPERPVPVMVTRLFELPVQISLGVYSLERPANPQPIAYLVLQADSFRMYKFVMSTLSTLVTIYLLLSLILTVAISWCINRLILHPLRNIARELNAIPAQELVGHQLALPRLHQDDEIGMLVRSYNLNQQLLQRHYEEQNENAMRFPVSDLPNKALLMEMLEQVVARKQTTALMIITCETLRDTAGVLKEAQREILLLTLVEKLKSVLSPRMILAQISGYDFAVIANGVQEPWHAITLGQQVLTIMSERLPIERIQLRPHCSIGVAMFYGDLTAEQLYSRAISAAFTARHKGKNQIQFFDPQQMEAAQKRLTEESDILNALENHQFAIWLQPQVEMTSGKLVSAEVLLRIQQPDGSWDLPDGLIDRIECCGLMVTVGHWVLEESCRLLAAWQERGIMLPLSVNLSALQLMHPNMVADMLELLTRYRIQPGTLILEVTESRRIDDPHSAVAILRPLRNAGVRVALDDFGMGYAGLRQLQHMKSLPIDVLKIDKMFVEGLPEDSSMIAAIIMLAQSLNLQMIAEGVETEAQRDWLAKAGVGIAQGFLFARPLPIEIFEESYLEEK
ncbi:TPA: biofilm formation regulator HmsP [Escherichia coli]